MTIQSARLRRLSSLFLLGLCLLSFFLLFFSSLRDATVVDELAHIPAGYAYVKYFDYRLNPEHPPFLKALSAVPLLFLPLQFPTTNPFWTSTVNGEWGVGGAFLFGLGNDAYTILQAARVFPILLTIGLILLVYFWSRRLFNSRWWALVPAAMVGLSPIFLAQGHLVTTDVASAFGTILGLWTFVHYIETPSRKNFFIAGIGFGIAELMKFSTVLLIPVYAILLIVHAIASRRERSDSAGRYILRYIGIFVGILAIGMLLILYPVYALFTANYPIDRQVADTSAIVGSLANQSCSLAHWSSCFAKLDIWSARHAITRPFAEYLLGVLMVLQRLTGTNVTYFLGWVSDQGSPWYFPIVYLLKETLPALAIIFLGFILGVGRFFKAIFHRKTHFSAYVREHFAQFAMIVFVVIYWIWSMKSPLNIGVRHLLPTLPLIYILAAGSLKFGEFATRSRKKIIFVVVMLIWLVGETIVAYPSYLSYFNEIGGGTANGYHYVTDSNYDWGQDMFALQSFVSQHPEVDKLALDFFGGSNPSYYLGSKYVAWQPSMGNPTSQGIHWFAVSINNLQDAIQPTAPNYTRQPQDSYQWLLATHPKGSGLGDVPTPDFRVGTTIFIYKI